MINNDLWPKFQFPAKISMCTTHGQNFHFVAKIKLFPQAIIHRSVDDYLEKHFDGDLEDENEVKSFLFNRLEEETKSNYHPHFDEIVKQLLFPGTV